MRMIQFLPTLAFGDAVGNDTIALQKAMQELGYETRIYAEAVDQRLPKNTASDLCQGMPELKNSDVILYHMSTGSKLNYNLENYPCHKIMIYHNITPPAFFHHYNLEAETNAQYGLDGLQHLVGKIDYCLADSGFNAQELRNVGFTCPVDVRPILIPFQDYEKKPDSGILKKYSQDDWVNLIFVGRIAPNKKQEDVIAIFAYYKKYINPKSRLIFVGNPGGMEKYYQRLENYVQALELEDVIFTGHIKFPEILAYYKIADLFLCMSEHEGFCVPLVEAMYFNVPVIAYRSCAVPETLGTGGCVVDSKNPAEISLLIQKILSNPEWRQKIIQNQQKRLEDFQYEKIKNLFAGQLAAFLNLTGANET
ncbi:MAG: glycosyltransferase family 4 protein [Oscillospiraceae bacterium]|nr:glycosyltransferase family 4 protein [Oscillospiraceae bacterium]